MGHGSDQYEQEIIAGLEGEVFELQQKVIELQEQIEEDKVYYAEIRSDMANYSTLLLKLERVRSMFTEGSVILAFIDSDTTVGDGYQEEAEVNDFAAGGTA